MNYKIVVFAVSMCWLGGVVMAGEAGSDWEYRGKRGPDHWGHLDPSFALCAKGKNQSPVNLTEWVEAQLPPIDFAYGSEATELVNSHDVLRVKFAPGSRIRVSGREFALTEAHFHTPSEHQVDGKPFALEAHLMHVDAEGNLAVVALLYEFGQQNSTLFRLWADVPEHDGGSVPLSPGVTAEDLLPDVRDYYRVNGSLTEPPCSEGVWWLILKQPLSASRDQVAVFDELVHHSNRRPIQPLNARPVLR
jgi:carbonic anhydrase